jgi:PHD/YefM family antitoxin component YafN of YafNO toxin-antitoxin module
MAVEDLESLEETLTILQDQQAMADLAEAEEAVKAGDAVDADALRAMIETRLKRR